MIIDPQKVPSLTCYRLMAGAIVPRPIAFVSTISGEGVHSEEIVAQMNACAGEYPGVIDEVEISGLTPVASDLGPAAPCPGVTREHGVPTRPDRGGQPAAARWEC